MTNNTTWGKRGRAGEREGKGRGGAEEGEGREGGKGEGSALMLSVYLEIVFLP